MAYSKPQVIGQNDSNGIYAAQCPNSGPMSCGTNCYIRNN